MAERCRPRSVATSLSAGVFGTNLTMASTLALTWGVTLCTTCRAFKFSSCSGRLAPIITVETFSFTTQSLAAAACSPAAQRWAGACQRRHALLKAGHDREHLERRGREARLGRHSAALYFPVSVPNARGDHVVSPSLYLLYRSTNSYSTLLRVNTLYSGCSTTGRINPRRSAISHASWSWTSAASHSLVPQ
jgi:hypothetical protein